MMELEYNDTAWIYPRTVGDYGEYIPGTAVEVACKFIQRVGESHGAFQDSVTSASRIYLPADTDLFTDEGYRLEGLIVKVNPFDAEGAEQFFQITNVVPARDVLLDNQIRHVECDLEKVTPPTGIS